MARPATRDPLLDELDQVPARLQQQLRELVRTLAAVDPSRQGLRFALDHPLAPRRGKEQGSAATLSAPEDVLDRIRSLLANGRVSDARRLAIEAGSRFPEHEGLRAAKRILDSDGNPILRPAQGAGTSQELDWLRNPPHWARGKWVALAGCEAVASAETLPDLVKRLDSMELPKTPLVHRID